MKQETQLVKLVHDEKGNVVEIQVGETVFSKDGITQKEISENVGKLRVMNRLRQEMITTFDALYEFDDDLSFLKTVDELPEEVSIEFKYKDEKRNFGVVNTVLVKVHEREKQKQEENKANKISEAMDQLFTSGNLSINNVLNVLGQDSVNEEWANKRYVTKEYLTADVIQQGALKSGYADRLEVTKDERLDMKICPKCKGVFVDYCVYGLYK